MFAWGYRLAGLLLILMVAGLTCTCSSVKAGPIDSSVDPQPAAVAQPSGLPAFPVEDNPTEDAAHSTSVVMADTLQGADFECAECYAIETGLVHPGTAGAYDAVGIWSVYNPYIEAPHASAIHCGYALYRAAGAGLAHAPEDFRQLVIEASPAYASDFPFPDDMFFPTPEYWVALANWDSRTWDFVGGPYGTLPEAAIDLSAVEFNYLSPTQGNLYYLIVVHDSLHILIHNSYIEYTGGSSSPGPVAGGVVDAGSHEFYRSYRHNLAGTELGLYGARLGNWGIEEYGSDCAYAMYRKPAEWFTQNIGDPANLEMIRITARPEIPPPYADDHYMFALPNYDLGQWEFFGPYNTYPTLEIDLSTVAYNYLSPLGNFYYMILAPELNGVVVEAAEFVVTPGSVNPTGNNWPMFGQNPQRTGLSPVNGPATGQITWTFDTNNLKINQSPVTGPDGTIYVSTYTYPADADHPHEGTQLFALDPVTTAVRWIWNSDGQKPIVTPLTVREDGVLIFGLQSSGTSYLEAINPDSSLRWEYAFPQGDGPKTSPVIGDNGLIYFGTVQGELCAIEETPNGGGFSPAIAWSSEIGRTACTAPALDSAGNVYFAATGTAPYPTSRLAAYTPDGSQIWLLTLNLAACSTAPAIDADDNVYFALTRIRHPAHPEPPTHGEVLKISPAGSPLWLYSCDYGPSGGPYVQCLINGAPAIDPTGTLWVGTTDNNVIGIDCETGVLAWEFEAGDHVRTTPVIGADGWVYFTCDDGCVYAIEKLLGGAPGCTLHWTLDAGFLYPNTPAIGGDARLYCTDYSDGVLTVIGP